MELSGNRACYGIRLSIPVLEIIDNNNINGSLVDGPRVFLECNMCRGSRIEAGGFVLK